MVSWLRGQAQSPFTPLAGYRDFLATTKDTRQTGQVDELVSLILHDKKINVLVPIEFIDVNSDTMIAFCNSIDLGKAVKKRGGKIFSLSDAAKGLTVDVFRKSELDDYMNLNYDSVFTHMKNTPAINTRDFDLNIWLDNPKDTFCCLAETRKKRRALIFSFFANGIVLIEQSGTGALHYVSY